MKNNYLKNGVYINPSSEKAVNLSYNGLLAKEGADSIYAVFGYGQEWKGTEIVKMNKTPNGFTADIPVSKTTDLNIVFKDSAQNWDNNGGKNYTFDVL